MRRTILLPLAIGIGLLSSAAWAGDLRCLVTGEGGLQRDVEVTVTPGDTTLTTARDGMCLFTGLREGTYRVAAEKVVDGELKGAVRDEVRVPASGRADVRLQLVRAIRIHEYMPLRVGNRWRYSRAGATDSITRCVSEFGPAGHTAIRITTQPAAWVRSSQVLVTYQSSSREGWAFHGRSHRGIRRTYRPPLLIPDLWPQGHTYRLVTTVQHDDGSPDKRLAREYTLTGFVDTHVPAGSFTDCAAIEWNEDLGGERTAGFMYLAKGIGRVRSDSRPISEGYPARYGQVRDGTTWALASYEVIPQTMPPHIVAPPAQAAPKPRVRPRG